MNHLKKINVYDKKLVGKMKLFFKCLQGLYDMARRVKTQDETTQKIADALNSCRECTQAKDYRIRG